MAAGIVYHNITTASGVTFSIACWVPDTSAPDVGAIPVTVPINSSGVPTGGDATNGLDVDVTRVPTDPYGANADAASATGSISAKLRAIATALGVTAFDLGTGTGGSRTLRWFQDTAQWIGGAGAVSSATQRVTLPSDDPAVAALGATSGAAVTTNANGTIQQYLRGLVTLFTTATFKAASTAPAATDPALVVALSPNSVNANGLALPASAAPVVIAPQTLDVVVTPTVTASGYSANNIIGGIMTFANILPSVGTNGVLQSITAKFKAATVTGNINVAIFKANPSNGTYADKTAGTYNSADMANLIGIYQLTTPLPLGAYTMTVYNLDGIGKAFVGSSTSLYAIATVAGTPTPASTSDFSLELSVLPG